ncbi:MULTISPECIES: hypothetical protein [Basfia]|uniref:Lipoprotein n=2 Tax=Basfia TaxID=697331 RepID=Q65UI0_MANSM|nr:MULTISPECIES: hypothetical protein [Basfia]AAU37380.1 unknown [[Mannheimia] succiniciproducens MBEL55E]QIM68198.1 hypothetical protein A4G13_01670 [Basfia succiniciproducens]SCX95662.1 hypothetical protein SAMN02910354_00950 [Basfia succiniciproducens]SEQ52071.1 hypothetical protein SAMN02910415_01602 [Basfia succiniciproducens]
MKKAGLTLALLLTGCGILGPSYSGETTAGALLKSDTERNINIFFRAIHQCSPEKIHTQINSAKPATQNSVEQAQETWTVTGCGKTEVFNIQYVGDGVGGTYIRMSKKN